MGLDTYLIKEKPSNEYVSLEDWDEIEVAYWRKCYGVNEWLKSKSKEIENSYLKEFSTDILKPIVKKMEKYIDKLIKKSNQLGYFVDNVDDLYSLVIELDNNYGYNNQNYDKLEKIILSFNMDGLDFDSFDNSIWSSLSTFIQTYDNFRKAEKESVLYYDESF